MKFNRQQAKAKAKYNTQLNEFENLLIFLLDSLPSNSIISIFFMSITLSKREAIKLSSYQVRKRDCQSEIYS
jgi:hypothetical protein